jgi:hypothetical protein
LPLSVALVSPIFVAEPVETVGEDPAIATDAQPTATPQAISSVLMVRFIPLPPRRRIPPYTWLRPRVAPSSTLEGGRNCSLRSSSRSTEQTAESDRTRRYRFLCRPIATSRTIGRTSRAGARPRSTPPMKSRGTPAAGCTRSAPSYAPNSTVRRIPRAQARVRRRPAATERRGPAPGTGADWGPRASAAAVNAR